MAGMTINFVHFVLGLLADRSMSGYDIRCFLKSLGWLVGNPSFGAIYPALHALLKDDLVSVETVSESDKRIRKIYTITDAGRQALADWVTQPVKPGSNVKSFVMQLILIGNLSPQGLTTHLEQRRQVVVDHRAALEQLAQDLGQGVNRGQRLAVEYGLTTANAELVWLDEMLAQVSTELDADRI